MDYIYTWANEDHTCIARKCEALGEELIIPVEEGNRHYKEFLSSGVIPEDYVSPPPVELTAEEKLAAAGLTVDELKGLLGM